jgi:hypothetical protein
MFLASIIRLEGVSTFLAGYIRDGLVTALLLYFHTFGWQLLSGGAAVLLMLRYCLHIKND